MIHGLVILLQRQCKEYEQESFFTAPRYRHEEIESNFRMSNMHAMLGCAQLEKLEEYIAKKRMIRQGLALCGIN